LAIALFPSLMLLREPRRSALAGAALSTGAGFLVYGIHLGLLYALRQESSLLLPLLVLFLANLLETARALRLMNVEQQARIHVLANDDPLTRLPNRFSLHAQLAHAIDGAQMAKSKLAVLLIDLDNFKAINDTLGHAVGDQMLVEATARLRASVRTNDIVARLGGDEFGIVVHGVDEISTAQCAEKIQQSLAKPYHLADQELYITSSVGISLYPTDGADVAALLKNADTALYRAKSQGRNSHRFFTPDLSQAAMNRLLIENQLRQGLSRNEFVLFYQPQINMQTGRISGIEALVRWNHPTQGLLTPDHFIPIAEDSGLILPLGEWVLHTACRQLQAWHAAGLTHIERVAVNLSARQFEQPELPELITSALRDTGLEPAHLELEITESVAMKNPQRSIEILKALRSMGITLALDDFGTGHSSLTYLKLFPITSLKIDSSFVRDIETDHHDAEICAATITLAHKLGLNVVAEGVEKVGQLLFLRNIECGDAQGYLISRPLPAEDVENFEPSPVPR
jgi:diguanylate cyclase (GGDEF)-like protein